MCCISNKLQECYNVKIQNFSEKPTIVNEDCQMKMSTSSVPLAYHMQSHDIHIAANFNGEQQCLSISRLCSYFIRLLDVP